jgi:hypothetical protein
LDIPIAFRVSRSYDLFLKVDMLESLMTSGILLASPSDVGIVRKSRCSGRKLLFDDPTLRAIRRDAVGNDLGSFPTPPSPPTTITAMLTPS